MTRPFDVAPTRPYVTHVHKPHVYKTIDAMHICGVGDHQLPKDFFRRNVFDQKEYFIVVLGLAYCNVCKCPMPEDEMDNVTTCKRCSVMREESWERVRTERLQGLYKHARLTSYQRRQLNQIKRDAASLRTTSPNTVGNPETHSLDRSDLEALRRELRKETNAHSILDIAYGSKVKNDGDK